jgi:hypothetical protein
MNDFATTLQPMAIVGIVMASIMSLGAVIFGFGYLWSRFVAGKSQQITDDSARQERVDKTLKDLVDAQERRFLLLESDHKDNLKELGKLQGVVAEQSKQQKWFEGIFVDALKAFFNENPTMAVELSAKIQTAKSTPK